MSRVHIELQRVQTWLFAVPRLRAMVGANALLGETLRVALPNLARETGRPWTLAPSAEAYPGADANDPLKAHDDPAGDSKDGILARDGGHLLIELGEPCPDRLCEELIRTVRNRLLDQYLDP